MPFGLKGEGGRGKGEGKGGRGHVPVVIPSEKYACSIVQRVHNTLNTLTSEKRRCARSQIFLFEEYHLGKGGGMHMVGSSCPCLNP